MPLPHRHGLPPSLQTVRRPLRPGPWQSLAARVEALPPRLRWPLAALIFSAFLSGVKLVPGIGTNIGPFELFAFLLVLLFLLDPTNSANMDLPPLSKILLAITVLAALSQLNIRPENVRVGLIQTAILANLFLIVTVFHNLVRRYRITPTHLLTLITLAVLVAGPWVILSGVRSGGDIQASGPFRNRAHAATYMLTSFWMVVIFLLLPKVRKRLRWAGYAAAAASLYAVAVSGRRSVYLALFLGLVGLTLAFILARQGKRLRMFATAGFAVLFIWLFYTYGSLLFPQAAFFQQRVGSVGSRLQAFVAPAEGLAAEGNFYFLQRHGVMLAFRDSPMMGIGWGGFVGSTYSPTGHEVHSTPFRFLAELGIFGLLLYLALIAYLLFHSLHLFVRMRTTSYSASYLALAIATWSLSVSYVYNRHITERTFWLFLMVFIAMRSFSGLVTAATEQRGASPAVAATRWIRPLGVTGPPPAPAHRVSSRHHRPRAWSPRRGRSP